jgi:hypothetical protein
MSHTLVEKRVNRYLGTREGKNKWNSFLTAVECDTVSTVLTNNNLGLLGVTMWWPLTNSISHVMPTFNRRAVKDERDLKLVCNQLARLEPD